jgi:hypothetical protein
MSPFGREHELVLDTGNICLRREGKSRVKRTPQVFQERLIVMPDRDGTLVGQHSLILRSLSLAVVRCLHWEQFWVV